jgi:hypothetical protein
MVFKPADLRRRLQPADAAMPALCVAADGPLAVSAQIERCALVPPRQVHSKHSVAPSLPQAWRALVVSPWFFLPAARNSGLRNTFSRLQEGWGSCLIPGKRLTTREAWSSLRAEIPAARLARRPIFAGLPLKPKFAVLNRAARSSTGASSRDQLPTAPIRGPARIMPVGCIGYSPEN